MAMTVRIISILAVAITIGPSLAYGSPACMTESEARAKFPKAHLVWVGTNHCWTFGAVSVHSRGPVLAAEPGVELPGRSRDALGENAGPLVDEHAHRDAAATALRAPSRMVTVPCTLV